MSDPALFWFALTATLAGLAFVFGYALGTVLG